MFEKEAEEYLTKLLKRLKIKKEDLAENQPQFVSLEKMNLVSLNVSNVSKAFQKGAEFGYNKGKEDVKYDLMMKLKDEGIVKPLKDSIFYNQRLSSQEQQELCSWIECAMDFGENLDEAVERIEKLEKTILKLRNCMNCKHRDTKGHSSCKDKGIVLCSHWEMKE